MNIRYTFKQYVYVYINVFVCIHLQPGFASLVGYSRVCIHVSVYVGMYLSVCVCVCVY